MRGTMKTRIGTRNAYLESFVGIDVYAHNEREARETLTKDFCGPSLLELAVEKIEDAGKVKPEFCPKRPRAMLAF